jgi:hypothetical protein
VSGGGGGFGLAAGHELAVTHLPSASSNRSSTGHAHLETRNPSCDGTGSAHVASFGTTLERHDRPPLHDGGARGGGNGGGFAGGGKLGLSGTRGGGGEGAGTCEHPSDVSNRYTVDPCWSNCAAFAYALNTGWAPSASANEACKVATPVQVDAASTHACIADSRLPGSPMGVPYSRLS